MAKCIICQTRKGKRKCRVTETFICSQCCGTSRDQEKCEGCHYAGNSTVGRNYKRVPYYPVAEMSKDADLEMISRVIENSLCRVWKENENVNDTIASRLIEMQLDRVHFHDQEPKIDDPVLQAGHKVLTNAVQRGLDQVSEEKLVRVLAAVYRSIQRRNVGGCTYLQFIRSVNGMALD